MKSLQLAGALTIGVWLFACASAPDSGDVPGWSVADRLPGTYETIAGGGTTLTLLENGTFELWTFDASGLVARAKCCGTWRARGEVVQFEVTERELGPWFDAVVGTTCTASPMADWSGVTLEPLRAGSSEDPISRGEFGSAWVRSFGAEGPSLAGPPPAPR